ncbi:MAG: hypothetical protein Q9193_001653 [Seirophora villosa]
MSWALPKLVECPNLEGLIHDDSSKRSSPVQYLAVTNDADDVVILKIKSPWLPHETLSWEAQVQSQFSWKNLHLHSTRKSETTPLEADRPAMTGTDGDQWISLYSSSMKQKAFIDRVMCMPCQNRRADLGLVLRKDRQSLRFEIYDCIPESSTIHKWMPVFHNNEGQNSVAYSAFAKAGDIELYWHKVSEASTDSARDMASLKSGMRTYQLTNEWDHISGLSFTSTTGGQLSLSASGFLSGPWTFRIDSGDDIRDNPLDIFSQPFRTALYDQASAFQNDFDQQHDLGGLCYTKTWGLASWGPYVASCVSYHPGDMVEYTLTSGERCHIIFSFEDPADNRPDNVGFLRQDTSDSADSENKISVRLRILTLISQIPVTDAFDCKVVYSICCSAFLTRDLQTIGLAEEAFRQLAVSMGISMEQELALLEDARISNLSMSRRIERLRHIASSRSSPTTPERTPTKRVLWDLCSICEEVVVWASTTEAACIAGHQFGMACNREYLDESSLLRSTAEPTDADSSKVAESGSRLQSPVIDGNAAGNDPQDHDIRANDEVTIPAPPRLEVTKSIFAEFDVCPFCRASRILLQADKPARTSVFQNAPHKAHSDLLYRRKRRAGSGNLASCLTIHALFEDLNITQNDFTVDD